jgi:hypothetical protein
MDALVTKILEVARQAGRPRGAVAGKGTISLVASEDAVAAGTAPNGKPAGGVLGGFDQCCKT